MLGNIIKTVMFVVVGAVVAAQFLSNRVPPRPAVPGAGGPMSANAVREIAPARSSVPPGYGRVELRPDRAGHYTAGVEIGGRSLAMLVDTGATLVSLTYEDAETLGIRPSASQFKVPISTANGMAQAAGVRLPEIRIGTIRAAGVEAIVLPRGAAQQSLLGMSFLRRLGGFEVASGNLILKP